MNSSSADAAGVVVAELHAHHRLHRAAGEAAQPPVAHPGAGRRPPVLLLELVAVDRIGQEVGEVLDEIQAVAQAVGRHAQRAVARRAQAVEGDAVPVGAADVGWIDGAEAGDQPGLDGPQGHLVGGVPVGRVAHAGDGEAVARIAAAVAQDPVRLAQVVRQHPRPVVPGQVERHQQVAVANPRGRGAHHPRPALAARADAHDRPVEHVDVVDVGRAGRREVAVLGEVGPLLVLHAADQLRNDQVRVGVAVEVGRGRDVQRHAGERRGEVRAVVQIESPQVVLVGLPLAAVLADDQARHRFEHLARPHDGPRFELRRGDGADAGGVGDAHQVLARVLQVGDVAERARAGHHHVGGQRQRQRGINLQRLAGGRHRHLLPRRREVHQPERERGRSRRRPLDVVLPGRVGGRGRHGAPGFEVDGHPREHAAGLVHDHAGNGAAALGAGAAGQTDDNQKQTDEHGYDATTIRHEANLPEGEPAGP